MHAKDPFVEIAAGSAIFKEGDPGHEMFIIESGSVDLLRQARGSEPIATLEAGDCFGEMALLEEQPRFATAIARTPVRLLRIDRGSFADVMRANVEIPIRIMRRMSSRLRRTELRAQEAHAALDDFKRRLASRTPEARSDVVTAQPPAAAPPVAAPAPPPVAAAPAPEPARDAAPAPPAAPVRYALRHAESGAAFQLAGEGEYLVGRPDPASGIDPEINLGPYDAARSLSRRHAKIVVEGARVMVREDAATTNGTFVNGERIQTGHPVTLKPGDKVKFGSVEIDVVA